MDIDDDWQLGFEWKYLKVQRAWCEGMDDQNTKAVSLKKAKVKYGTEKKNQKDVSRPVKRLLKCTKIMKVRILLLSM